MNEEALSVPQVSEDRIMSGFIIEGKERLSNNPDEYSSFPPPLSFSLVLLSLDLFLTTSRG